MDERDKAIEEVRRMSPQAENIHIVNIHPDFLDGVLYVVGLDISEKHCVNYVYSDGSDFHLTKNEALLISMVSKKSKRVSLLDSFGGITGVIALIITCTIAYIIINEPRREIPEILSAALTTILGFYFGSQVTKR